MIKLKDKVNKTTIMRVASIDSINMYKNAWQPELQQTAFMKGAKYVFDLLRDSSTVNRK